MSWDGPGDRCEAAHVGTCAAVPRWSILSNSVQQVSLLSVLAAVFYGCEGDDTGVCCGEGEG